MTILSRSMMKYKNIVIDKLKGALMKTVNIKIATLNFLII